MHKTKMYNLESNYKVNACVTNIEIKENKISTLGIASPRGSYLDF